MEFKEEMQLILKDMARKIEYERFMMGLGKCEFAKLLGMHYHTYMGFIKQDRITHPRTGSLIANFLISRNVDVKALGDQIWDLIRKE